MEGSTGEVALERKTHRRRLITEEHNSQLIHLIIGCGAECDGTLCGNAESRGMVVGVSCGVVVASGGKCVTTDML